MPAVIPGIFQASPPVRLGSEAWFVAGMGQTGTALSLWADMSGNGRDLEQASAPARPAVQADGSVLFDGVSQWMATASFLLPDQPTVYMVANHLTWTSNDVIFDGVTPSSCFLSQGGVSPQVFMFAGAIGPVSGGWALNTKVALAAMFEGAGSILSINGTDTSGNAGAGSLDGFTLGAIGGGATNHANIQVWEIIIRSGADDATTRAMFLAYLQNKYGI